MTAYRMDRLLSGGDLVAMKRRVDAARYECARTNKQFNIQVTESALNPGVRLADARMCDIRYSLYPFEKAHSVYVVVKGKRRYLKTRNGGDNVIDQSVVKNRASDTSLCDTGVLSGKG